MCVFVDKILYELIFTMPADHLLDQLAHPSTMNFAARIPRGLVQKSVDQTSVIARLGIQQHYQTPVLMMSSLVVGKPERGSVDDVCITA